MDEQWSDDMLSRIEDAKSRFFDALGDSVTAATELVGYYSAAIAEAVLQRKDTSEAARSDDWRHSPAPIDCDDKMWAAFMEYIRKQIDRTLC